MAHFVKQKRTREDGTVVNETSGPIIIPHPPIARPSLPPPPTPWELATNFTNAMTRWVGAGFRVVTRGEYDRRAAICDRCEFWDGKARAGLGHCKAPGCGCTAFKRWLATERCVLGKW